MLVSPNIGTFLRAGRQAGLFFFQEILQIRVLLSSREGQKIYHKGFAMQKILHHSYFI
jgi:hypothetical protein